VASKAPGGNLASAEKQLSGGEKAQLFKFAKRMVKWKPEERGAKELLKDPWLNTI
jgi:hypothetical protein